MQSMQSGMFSKLRLESLEQEHGRHWTILREKYGFNVDQLSAPSSLDDLAQQCIHLCREHLFSSWLSRYQWAGNEEMAAGWRPWDPDELLSMNNLEQALTPALCDHLIITFAHQFYCDNLEPIELATGLEAVFTCQALYRQDEHKDSKDDDNFRKSELKKFRDNYKKRISGYYRNLRKIIDEYRALLQANSREDEVDAIQVAVDQIWACMQDNNSGLTDSFKDKKSDSADWRKAKVAAPDWLFTLAMASNWKTVLSGLRDMGFLLWKNLPVIGQPKYTNLFPVSL